MGSEACQAHGREFWQGENLASTRLLPHMHRVRATQAIRFQLVDKPHLDIEKKTTRQLGSQQQKKALCRPQAREPDGAARHPLRDAPRDGDLLHHLSLPLRLCGAAPPVVGKRPRPNATRVIQHTGLGCEKTYTAPARGVVRNLMRPYTHTRQRSPPISPPFPCKPQPSTHATVGVAWASRNA